MGIKWGNTEGKEGGKESLLLGRPVESFDSYGVEQGNEY